MTDGAREKADLARRIRDALGRLGYPVPPGRGFITPEAFAALAPAIRHFVGHDPALSRAVREAKDGIERARLVAAGVERAVARRGPLGAKVGEAVSALTTGFLAYRNVQQQVGMLAGFLDTITNFAATKRRQH